VPQVENDLTLRTQWSAYLLSTRLTNPQKAVRGVVLSLGSVLRSEERTHRSRQVAAETVREVSRYHRR
jgi:hypothetical protein